MSHFVIDAELGVKQSFGDADFWRMAITELLQELPGMLADIESAFAEKRFGDLALYVHRLHGSSLFCGTFLLQKTAHALERACFNTPNQIEFRLNELREEAALLNKFVEEHGIPEAENFSKSVVGLNLSPLAMVLFQGDQPK